MHTHTNKNSHLIGNSDVKMTRRCPCSVMVKVMDSGIVVSEFEFLSLYSVHFQTNTLGKGMNLLIIPTMG